MKRLIAVVLIGTVLMLSMATPARAGGEKAILTLGIGLLRCSFVSVLVSICQEVTEDEVKARFFEKRVAKFKGA